MAKLLITADYHFFDYKNKTPKDKARLLQSYIVGENIIEAGQRYGCDSIVFAGDILERPINRPYIENTVRDVLWRIMENFKSGYYILGNHDLDSKESLQSLDDTSLGILVPPNLEYCDGKIKNIDGSLIAFSNWKPSFDLSWIKTPVDLLITHATIDYSGKGFIKSQKLDLSNVALVISGDIHKADKTKDGRIVSIGIPQRCKMGDSEECTGVIYDTVTHQWTHVNLNPKDNLLKFKYTPDKNQEGYHPSDNTYYTYKSAGAPGGTGISQIQIPLEHEIQQIIGSVISKNSLDDIHKEILAITKNSEVDLDYNYYPLRMSCCNWRSLGSMTLNFEHMDRFLIRGDNGSGKSSIMMAIKYALIDANGYGAYCQQGKDYCWTELEFIYQGKNVVLRRGTTSSKKTPDKTWGLWIDGIPQPYNNMLDFKADVLQRFPFTDPDYINMYILGKKDTLLKDLKSDSKVDLLSKLLHLNRIGLYNEVAQKTYDSEKEKIDEEAIRLRETKSILTTIDERLGKITLPEESYEELSKKYTYYKSLEIGAQKYSKYLQETTGMSGRIEYLRERQKALLGDLKDLRPLGILMVEQEEHQKSLDDLRAIEVVSRNNSQLLGNYKTELSRVNSEGSALFESLTNLDLNRDVCPVCGNFMDQQHYQEHKKSLEGSISDLLKKKKTLEGSIKKLSGLVKNQKSISSEIGEIQKDLSKVSEEITLVKSKKEELQRVQDELESLKKSSGVTEVPEKIILPDNYGDLREYLRASMDAWELYRSLQKEKEDTLVVFQTIENSLRIKEKVINSLKRYIDVTGNAGEIWSVILGKLSTDFSDTTIRYSVRATSRKSAKRGVICHLEFIPEFFNGKNWFEYDSCSDGQKTLIDINFISKLTLGTGFLILDEFLATLTQENTDICLELVSSLPISCLIVTSHMESLTAFNNKLLRVSLDPTGQSNVLAEQVI